MSAGPRPLAATARTPGERTKVLPARLDLVTPGHRRSWVAFEHPTLWGSHLVPVEVWVGPEATDGRGVLVIGSTHGNEYEGPVAIKRLARTIALDQVRGRLVFVPTLNVAAFAAGTRDTPEDGVNLNRAFPGDAAGSITSRLARFVHDQLFPAAHVVLDLHSGGETLRFPPLVSFHHVTDPSQRRATEAAARGFGTRFTMIYHDSTAGLLTSTAERLGKITIGSELGWGSSIQAEGVARATTGILAAAISHGQLAPRQLATDGTATGEQILADNSDPSCYLHAPFAGHFEPAGPIGSAAAPGETVGWLHDFDRIDLEPEPIRAPHAGWITCQAWRAAVIRGQVVTVVARTAAWSQ